MQSLPSFNKILVIQTAFIGDVVLATAVLEELHRILPSARLDFLLRKGNESVLTGHPFVGLVLVWDKKTRKYPNLFSLIKRVRSERYDLVINLQRFFSTGLLMGLSKAKVKVCFDKNPLSFLSDRVVQHVLAKEGKPTHEVSRNLHLIEFLGAKGFALPKLYPAERDFNQVKFQGKYITISPTSVWFTKQLPKEKWLEFMERVGDDTTIFLLGGPTDFELCNWLKTNSMHKNVVVKAGQLSILESAALMRNAIMNYANDSAPLHFASAMDAPITAIYCSTVPAFGFTPLSNSSHIIETKEGLSCRPCGLHGKKQCPEGHFKCADIEVQRLLEKLR
ncbi:MAG: glycosyltransferase family 9 protein [Saprospiraceae bacterium]|nr:glycosyltransferase family 9 protein [Saprospiraceae bacterium]